MKKVLIFLAAAAVAVFLGVLFFLRSSDPINAAGLAPADSAFFINIPNAPLTMLRWRETALAKIGNEPEVKAFLEKPLKNLQSAPGNDQIFKILTALKPGNIFLSISNMTPSKKEALLGFQFWGKKADFENAVAHLRKEFLQGNDVEETKEHHHHIEILATKHGDESVFSAMVGRWGFLSDDLSLLKDAIDRAMGGTATSPDLASDPRYSKVLSNLPEDADLLLFIQPEQIRDTLQSFAQSARNQAISIQLQAIQSKEAIGAALKLEGKLQHDTIFVLRPGQPISPQKLTHGAMAYTNPNTSIFLDGILNFGTLPTFFNNLASIYPAITPSLPLLTSTFFDAYGPEFTIFQEWPKGQMALAPVLAISIRNPERANEIFATTEQFLPTAKSEMRQGVQTFTIPHSYSPLVLAQNEQFLFLGTDAELVTKSALKESTENTLAQSKSFQSALPAYRAANEAFCYLDTRAVFERLYNMFTPVIRFTAALMPSINQSIDPSKLPQAETISRHLPPIVLSQKRTEDGTLIESHGPVSMSQFLLMATGLWLGTQPAAGNR